MPLACHFACHSHATRMPLACHSHVIRLSLAFFSQFLRRSFRSSLPTFGSCSWQCKWQSTPHTALSTCFLFPPSHHLDVFIVSSHPAARGRVIPHARASCNTALALCVLCFSGKTIWLRTVTRESDWPARAPDGCRWYGGLHHHTKSCLRCLCRSKRRSARPAHH